MNLQVEPSEKRRKTKNSSPPPTSSPLSSPLFYLLPDEITVNYLARRTFHSLISSTDLYTSRSHQGCTEPCLYVCLWDPSSQFPQWFNLWVNPNRTLPNDMITQKKKKEKTTRQLLVPIASSEFPCASRSSVVIGSDIYVIGGPIDNATSSAIRILDCGSHTWRHGPSMKVARKNAASCVHDGKIYVMEGCKEDDSWAEVFDSKTRTWECLPDPDIQIRNCSIYRIAEMEGKIMYMNVKGNTYAYDTKQCKWECCKNTSVSLISVFELHSYWDCNGQLKCAWYDIKDGCWKEVKGLDSLGNKYKRKKYCMANIGCCGGKLFVIWQVSSTKIKHKKIWCSEIVLEKRDGGDVWGTTKWVDVVHSVPLSCRLLHCLAVSV